MTAQQRIFRERRRYNQWVANETLEDYALRFTAKKARRWSIAGVANTALGTVSFLALEAIGGAITLSYGFTNAITAILAVSAIIFATGIPISYYAARYGVDIDLLTRGAGFGYIGSTITSLIYASFTFIFFALEASIMALALKLCFGIPLWLGYLICTLLVIPLVTHGITLISRFQFWSQIIWLIMQITPFIFLGLRGYLSPEEWTNHTGLYGSSDGAFDLIAFGAACSVIFALIAQTGEQVDFLRFMPRKTRENRLAWWAAVIAGGPGWVIPGAIKLLLGSFLAVVILNHGVLLDHAADPSEMYYFVFKNGLPWPEVNHEIVLALTGIFVIVSQLKINVANAYAGSLAWSNFFSRLTHNHPGRVVWLVFNVSLALVLMEVGIFEALEKTLRLYSNIPVAWLAVITADLVINKPLGLSPKGIEFRRAYLFDLNPVGVGSMVVATVLSFATYLGAFGESLHGLAPFVALGTAFTLTPLIAYLTGGRYYLARTVTNEKEDQIECCICRNTFEPEDMAFCPAYAGQICSLCCTLDARCHDLCKEDAKLSSQVSQFLDWSLPPFARRVISSQLAKYLTLLFTFSGIIGAIMLLVSVQVGLNEDIPEGLVEEILVTLFFILVIIVAIAAWPFVLAQESSRAAHRETQRNTELLVKEIEAHRRTDRELQLAKETAEAASTAKSRYVGGISHELRTPLNAIIGYAQLLESEPNIPKKSQPALRIIQRSGEHISSLIDGLLDISMIEAGRIEIYRDEVALREFLDSILGMFRPQALEKGLEFRVHLAANLPDAVITDEKRLRQILTNLLSNAIRATSRGFISFSVSYKNQVARFEVEDSGVGIKQDDRERVYRAFERVTSDQNSTKSGTGLGLTITKLMAEAMGGSISLESTPGVGTRFTVKLFLSYVAKKASESPPLKKIQGYSGARKRVFVIDDDPDHVSLMTDILRPLGFDVSTTINGQSALETVRHIKPDLILLDIFLPDINGWEVARKIKEDYSRSVPIIIISANPREDNLRTELSERHEAYLMKPVRIPDLLEQVKRILGLSWIYADSDEEEVIDLPTALSRDNIPSIESINRLVELCEIGHTRGLLSELDKIERKTPAIAPTVRYLMERVHNFELIEFKRILTEFKQHYD